MSRAPSVAAFLALVLLLAACGGASTGSTEVSPFPPPDDLTPPPDAPSDGVMSDQERAHALRVLELTNRERTSRGLPALAWDDGAAGVAYAHSLDMDVRNFFDHTNPDGELPWDRLEADGITYSTAGENIAWGYPSPEAVMDGWMNSDGHRANILRTSFTRLGVGVHVGSDGVYWTQVFFTP